MDGRTPDLSQSNWLAYACRLAVVSAVYFVTGKLGLLLPAAHQNVTLLWAPSGIALAAVLLWGWRLWPAVTLGAFLVNYTTGPTTLAAVSIAAGNTLEALVAAWVLRRVIGFELSMSRVRDVLGLFALAAPVGCAVAATCGALTLYLGGIDWPTAKVVWINWWMGDVMGALLVTPLMLTWARPVRCAAPDTALEPAQAEGLRCCGLKTAEAVLLLGAFAAFCQFPFAGWLGREHAAGPLAFLPFPFLIWAALRFAQRGAATLTFLAAVIAAHATVRNVGAFAGGSTQHGLTYLFLYMAVASMTSMLLAAALAERQRTSHVVREREAILRGLYDSIPMMTGVVDVAGERITFVSCNLATAEFIGRTQAEVVGKQITDFVDPRDSWIERYREAEQTRRPVRFDFVQQTARGHRSLEVVVSHIGALPEGRSRFSFTAEDVTERRVAELRIHRLNDELRHRRLLAERKRAEDALAEERNLLRTLVDNLPDYVYAKDLDCRFILNNTASANAMGVEPEEAIGKTDFDFHPQDLACRYYQDDQGVIRMGRPLVNREELNYDHNGRRRWVLTTKAPLRDRQGNVVGLVGIGHDITERKEMEEELFEAHLMLEQRVEERTEELASANAALEGANSALAGANEELALSNAALQAEIRRRRETEEALEEANKAKDQFLAVLSHELRTPLTPVLATVTAMLDENDSGEAPLGTELGCGHKAPTPAELRNTLEMIRRNVQLEARLIDDLLDLTRISKGKLQLNCDTVDVHEVLRNSVEICRPDIAAKRLSVAFELRAGRHHVHADAARLQQVFWNLIKNAVKFTPDGGRLVFRSEDSEGGGVRLRVIDSGIGIEPHVMARIFNPFEQGESSITRKFGGLGLGLVITKAVVEAHGGTIEAESLGRGQGASFTVELQTVAAPVGRADAVVPSAAAFEPEPQAAAGLNMLLVEDNQDTLRFMSRLLRRVGHRVTTADSLATARNALLASRGQERFDLLISDIGLPDGNGLELLGQLRELAGEGYPFKAIALSGYGMDEDIEKSRQAGFVEHLTKPVDFQLLETVIARVTAGGGDAVGTPEGAQSSGV